jgi:hypothetical protein
MTKARPRFVSGNFLAQRVSSAGSAVRMGSWVYTPAPVGGVLATLHDSCRRVDLRYSAKLLEDLLTELGRIEAQAVPLEHGPTGHKDHSRELWRQTSHV